METAYLLMVKERESARSSESFITGTASVAIRTTGLEFEYETCNKKQKKELKIAEQLCSTL